MKKAELIEELKRIGLQDEVHSSLSSFGHVEGGAETVIEALIKCVTERGSIFMPSLCFSQEMELTEDDRNMGITVKIKKLPEDEPRTAMVYNSRYGISKGSYPRWLYWKMQIHVF